MPLDITSTSNRPAAHHPDHIFRGALSSKTIRLKQKRPLYDGRRGNPRAITDHVTSSRRLRACKAAHQSVASRSRRPGGSASSSVQSRSRPPRKRGRAPAPAAPGRHAELLLSGRCLSHQVLGQCPDCGTNSPASGVEKNARAQEASRLDSPGTIRNEQPDCGLRSLAVAQPPLTLEWAA
jgi:hypothetical protein